MSYTKPRIGLVQFLGSNCDQDCLDAFKTHFDITLQTIWHTEPTLPKLDALILPGGFSYGDFLRSGSLASHTKIMASVKEFAKKGGAILGICNGFQILTESHVLPGALLKNVTSQFICSWTDLEVSKGETKYHRNLKDKAPLKIPIAHGEGRYFAPDDVIKRLQDQSQILFRYKENLNGSCDRIAGILSENGRVLGMMPHPERATDKLLGGSDDGLAILKTFMECCL